MKVLFKMTTGLTAAGIAIFGSYGVYRMHVERGELVAAIEREVLLLGHSLQATAEYALRDRQIEDIRDVLRDLELVDRNVDVVVYTPDGRAILTTEEPPLTPEMLAANVGAAMDRRQVLLQLHPPDDLTLMSLALPLSAADGELLGGLVLLRPLNDLQEDLSATRRTVAFTVLVFVLTGTAVGLLLGTAYIGRPLERTVAAMRRVRAGDLDSTVPVKTNDEIGDLAMEFNAMLVDLRDARVRLEEANESRRRLQHTMQEADKLITIGQLSAGLAHEIGSPLQVLNGRARWLESHADNPVETRRIAGILVQQSDRIARIVEQLLRFARKRPAQIAPVELESSVRAVVELSEYEARRRGVELTAHCADNLPLVLADADRVQQVVLNLVTNALNATPRGGRVDLTLAPAARHPCGSPAVRLTVTDSGHGITPDDRERLFEPFFTTRSAAGGTGLGLAVVNAIVTEHGGTIAVESTVGGGTRFTVDLPAEARASITLAEGNP